MTYSFFANDTWRVNNRLTITPGLRFDRFANSLPEQEHPAGRFSSTPIVFAAVDDLVSWNLFGPRFGITYDLSGGGRSVVKFNYGQYWWNPSNDISTAANPNRSPWFRRYRWADANQNGHLGRGRTRPQSTGLLSSQGGVASTRGRSQSREYLHARVSRRGSSASWRRTSASAPGLVMRQIRNQRTNKDANRPFSAFNVPATLPDPGPDGRAGTGDDGPPISGFNLNRPPTPDSRR